MRPFLILITTLLINPLIVFGQKDPAWDDTSKNLWDSAFRKVEIPSSTDGKLQKAYIYCCHSKIRKPLIVSLHTWSGNYTQKDPLTKEILARDWNYIHPDFRGPNKNGESTVSRLVISDIEDAIQYALKQTNSDPNEVHIVGVSGGGLATLAAYMNVHYPVKSFSAWAPISDLEAWYWESVGRKQKYAEDILHSVSDSSVFNKYEALRRSPLMQDYPKELRKNAKLFIYEGIHDGYTGSVPVTHSINMYNRLVGELKYGFSSIEQILPKAQTDTNLVSQNVVIDLLTKRYNPEYNKLTALYDRDVYLSRTFQNVSLKIFEGGHEQLAQALGLIPVGTANAESYNILTLGDSNGANKEGWVDQLKSLLPKSRIINISKAGRTIGFDNNGKPELNALRNIDNYLNEAEQKSDGKKLDFIILCLGTNDCKSEYEGKEDEVLANFELLLTKIRNHRFIQKSYPALIYVTPPPFRTSNIAPKYEGGNERLDKILPRLIKAANGNGFKVIDIYHPLQGILDYYAADGVHMTGDGQRIIADKINELLIK
jgi:Lysophospholipase L1 and related esterases